LRTTNAPTIFVMLAINADLHQVESALAVSIALTRSPAGACGLRLPFLGALASFRPPPVPRRSGTPFMPPGPVYSIVAPWMG
jgi:hypothetical protein